MNRLGWPDAEGRKQLVAAAAKRLGGKAALGRRLGYQDGAFVGQMVRGERAITEKTLETLAAWPELRDLFEKPPLAREESASYELAALGPTIEQAVEVIGIALAGASAEAREAVAANMAGWARAGGKEPWASVITSLLNANSGKRSARDR